MKIFYVQNVLFNRDSIYIDFESFMILWNILAGFH